MASADLEVPGRIACVIEATMHFRNGEIDTVKLAISHALREGPLKMTLDQHAHVSGHAKGTTITFSRFLERGKPHYRELRHEVAAV